LSKSIGYEFMLRTKWGAGEASDQANGLPQPPLQMDYDAQSTVIALPMPEEIPPLSVDLLELIELRTSVRDYPDKPLTLLELSYLLWCTQGVKEVLGTAATKRNVPSAGSRHPFETYLLINRVEGVKPGLYRFLALEHKLLVVNLNANIAEEVIAGCLRQNSVAKSAVTFIWAAVASRSKWRYGERAYRYLHLDAGHICQNLYLTAQVIGCGVCAIAAFDDDYLNQVLNLDGKEQFAVYIAAAGKK
jgi:SagB-type dehydrogenase family enzyme